MYTQTAGGTSVAQRLSELSRYRHVTIIVLRLSYSLNHSFDDAQATPPVIGNASGKGAVNEISGQLEIRGSVMSYLFNDHRKAISYSKSSCKAASSIPNHT